MDALQQLKDPIADLMEDPEVSTPSASTALKLVPNANPRLIAGKFKLTPRGVYLVTPSEDEDKAGKEERVCGKLDVVALIRDKDSGQWGKLLHYEDPDNQAHEWAMPMAALQGDGAEVRRALAAGGLDISQTLKMRNALVDYLSACQTDLRARSVERTGWHRCVDGYLFVLPDQAVGESREVVRFQSDTVVRTYTVAGTAAGWRTEVAALCAGNSRCILAICAGFASLLLEFSGLESGGINLKGSSSTGKTTALAAAASVFGGPDYVNRWRATSNGLESLAAMHNDTLLILDELAQVDPRDAGEIAYMLANGQGKQRSGRTGSARPRQTWQLLFLSAGEIGLAQHMADGGKRAKAGQEVRLVDVEADAGQGLGLFDTLHDCLDGAALSTAIKAGAVRHHGHAVLEFAKILADDADELHAHIAREMPLFIQACLPDERSGGQVHRVCERFALIAIAGELASANSVTGWQQGEAYQAAKRCFTEWLATRGSGSNAEPGAMIEAVRGFIARHEEARFTDLDIDQDPLRRVTINRAGWRRKADNGREYLIDPSVFRNEVCLGFDVTAVCKVLVAAGCLESAIEAGKLRYNLKRRIAGESPRRVYVVTAKIWEA
jgi:putative DNA primase/helicase